MSQNPTPDSPTYRDEVSLREVYFILLRGLPIIIGLALVAGVAAYFLNARQQAVYSAQSTIMVTPPAIAIEGDDTLTFRPANEISFQSYSTLARSQEVLQNAVAQLPDAQISPNQLLSLSSLREIAASPPNANSTVRPLSVVHTVRNANPERAAMLADAWADSTLAAVRRSLFASLELVSAQTAREATRLQQDVEAVEAEVQTFAAQDEGSLLTAELEGRARQLTDGRARLSDLEAEIAASRARIAALQETLGDADAVSAPVASANPALFAVLNAQEALGAAEGQAPQTPTFAPSGALESAVQRNISGSPLLSGLPGESQDELTELSLTLYRKTVAAVASDLTRYQREEQRDARRQARASLDLALLGYATTVQVQSGSDSAQRDPLTLVRQAELQRERVALEGLLAEAQTLRAALPGYTRQVAQLQRRIATLDQRRNRLDRELEKVLTSYDTVTQLQASVSYLTNLAPTNARILSQASVPTTPTGPRRAFNTAIAAAVGGVLGLVFIFLRAAIRRPSAPRKIQA